MSFRIVSDSSSNVLSMGDSNYTTVPLKIIARKEYIDDQALDLSGMMEDLRNHNGKSGSSAATDILKTCTYSLLTLARIVKTARSKDERYLGYGTNSG